MSRSARSLEWLLTEAVFLNNLTRLKELVTSHGLPSGGYAVLVDAVKLNRIQIVRYLIEKGAKINGVGSNLDTPLHIAVTNEDSLLVQTLLDSNAVVDGTEGSALLLKAVKLGHAEIVKNLLNKGAKVNSADSNGDTPLHFAVKNGDLALIQMLLESNAAVNAANIQKETPLHAAVEKGNEGIIRLLLINGACSLSDKSNFEPLHLACFEQSASIVELLLCARAQLGSAHPQSLDIALLIASQKGNQQMISALLNAGADYNVISKTPLSHHRLPLSVCYGSSPIHLACEGGYLNIVKLLLERSKELIASVQLSNNFTPLHSACGNGHLDVVQFLCSEEADRNIEAAGNLTPLHLAARGGYLKIVDVLCKNGANIEARTAENLTPILLAAMNRHEIVVKMLLYLGANVNAKDDKENPLLYFALYNKSSFLTRCILEFQPEIDEKLYAKVCDFFNYEYNLAYDYLIEYCVLIKHKDVRKFSLVKAVQEGYKNAVETLLVCGFNPNNTSVVLHVAVQLGLDEILELLLKSGCVQVEDSRGKTPICYLLESGEKDKYVNICRSLLSRGADLNKAPGLLESTVDYEYLEVCKLLLENNVNVNTTGCWGETPLHHTVEYHYVKKFNAKVRAKMARLLLENGANISAKDNYDATALDRAIQYKRTEVIVVLLQFKRDLCSRDFGIKTPMWYAYHFNRDDISQELRKNVVEVDAFERQDAVRMVRYAAGSGRTRTVKSLLQFNLDINAQDAEGNTALHKAMKEKHHEVVSLLLEMDCDVNVEDHSKKTPLGVVEAYKIKHALRNVVVRHMLKLRVAGLLISAKNKRLLREVWLADNDEYNQFEEDCKAEVKRMKQKKLGHLKLHDVIVKPSYSAFVTDEQVIRELGSVNFNEFPIYQDLIRMKSKKINEINLIKKWLRVLIKTHSVLHQVDTPDLPPESWLMIVSYLDKKDARCLIECGEALKRQLC